MATITLLVGPPGSGKTTLALDYVRNHPCPENTARISQDDQGKEGHMSFFNTALSARADIIVDRMNFDKNQRSRYLEPARKAGYATRIIVVHTPLSTCLERCNGRLDHPTIKDVQTASKVINFFFSNYERVSDDEADEVLRLGWADHKAPEAIICDLDGTLCNVEHRRHHVRPPENTLVGPDGSMIEVLGRYDVVDLWAPLPKFKKNWPAFFAGIKDDTVNKWCADILKSMCKQYKVVYCSGRGDNERKATVAWLEKHGLDSFSYSQFESEKADLYMRHRQDSRRDDIVKEIILDFEILPRYRPVFMIDDRQQVVDMWRKRGFVCLQCDKGDF